ncbi:FAD-dependent oxidoreductase [Clostridium bowmanii]|uniref:FAD-dependent oxidoreductase n=1 Tax=Clostridium bowmanii TaxID=132925 RepID=UPI001C0DE02B|nr:FAD-dependent oxidoreductase [Clostridium bowmanii]MBU3189633.1 FAD-dependent oxidoreductase [Clostridium bowmanii]MCA1073521.1 FAD-dependent oxidoreductase [Clostridium bowmanii]
MSLFSDLKALLIPKEIVFRKVIKEGEDVYTFLFDACEPLKWKAGQHGAFVVKHTKIKKGTRPFSIASSPLENEIMISMKIGKQPSDYKKALLEMNIGMKMILRGPMGGFHIDPTKATCFIAGGIGITPFRSMIKDIVMREKDFKGKINLLYINRTGKFLYENELKTFIKDDHIQIDFFTDNEELTKSLKEIAINNKDIKYYLAGPKLMNDSIKSILLGQSVNKKNIRVDTFLGY